MKEIELTEKELDALKRTFRPDDGSDLGELLKDTSEVIKAKIVFRLANRIKNLRKMIQETPKSDNPEKACERGMLVGRAKELQELLVQLGG